MHFLLFVCYSFCLFFEYINWRKNSEVSVLISSLSELDTLPPNLCLYCIFVEWHQYGLPAYPVLYRYSLTWIHPSTFIFISSHLKYLRSSVPSLSLVASPSSQDLNVISSDFCKRIILPVVFPCLFLYYHVRHDANKLLTDAQYIKKINTLVTYKIVCLFLPLFPFLY